MQPRVIMGTEVVRPQHCLRPPPRLLPCQKPNPGAHHPKAPRKPAKRPAMVRAGAHVVAGQVTILKRGEYPESWRERGMVSGTGRLGHGPGPEMNPRRTRLVAPKGVPAEEVYAGTAFATSPSPSALPLPSFSRRKEAAAKVDDSATRDLRRILGLD